MVKKLDKLLLKSFIGPFVLTFTVAVFILLTQFMLKYFDDLIGKNLGPEIFGQLLAYFAIHMMPMALPLAVLLSSIMTFGNLGEHFELTAIKSAGITLTRTLFPILIFTLLLTAVAMISNDKLVPRTNIKAWSLLYDIKQKKPSLDLKEGLFYSGIPGYSIKVSEKYPDNITLKDVIIYDHTTGERGNMNAILADSGRMFTMNEDRYLVFELFDGNSYEESKRVEGGRYRSYREPYSMTRTSFDKARIVFNLSSFAWERSDESLFANHKYMKTMSELQSDIDTMYANVELSVDKVKLAIPQQFSFHKPRQIYTIDSARAKYDSAQLLEIQMQEARIEPEYNETEDDGDDEMPHARATMPIPRAELNTTLVIDDTTKKQPIIIDSANVVAAIDSIMAERRINDGFFITRALNKSRTIKSQLSIYKVQIENKRREIDNYEVERYKKIAQAVSCLIMFLIGAPLGAIIKKGGLGVPVLVSTAFYIIFYVLTITGEKLGKTGQLDTLLSVWLPNLTLLPFGLFFLVNARRDSRIFEADFYFVTWLKIKDTLKIKKK